MSVRVSDPHSVFVQHSREREEDGEEGGAGREIVVCALWCSSCVSCLVKCHEVLLNGFELPALTDCD